MDVASIRTALAEAAADAGWNAWSYAPDDPQTLPAAVVGAPEDVARQNRVHSTATFEVRLYASLADAADASARLDLAISEGVTGSFLDALAAVASPPWGSVVFTGTSGAYQLVQMPGDQVALSVGVRLLLAA